ncbi:MAG: hypothetical protein RL498_232 [Pseudomonadota bacterium]|jgi:hypothetical protein
MSDIEDLENFLTYFDLIKNKSKKSEALLLIRKLLNVMEKTPAGFFPDKDYFKTLRLFQYGVQDIKADPTLYAQLTTEERKLIQISNNNMELILLLRAVTEIVENRVVSKNVDNEIPETPEHSVKKRKKFLEIEETPSPPLKKVKKINLT